MRPKFNLQSFKMNSHSVISQELQTISRFRVNSSMTPGLVDEWKTVLMFWFSWTQQTSKNNYKTDLWSPIVIKMIAFKLEIPRQLKNKMMIKIWKTLSKDSSITEIK